MQPLLDIRNELVSIPDRVLGIFRRDGLMLDNAGLVFQSLIGF